jgi:heptosyltransferase-1
MTGVGSVSTEPRSGGSPAQSTILAVRVGRLGDMVMVTPALRALRGSFPDSEIHLLTSAAGRLVLGAEQLVDEFIHYDRSLIRGLLGRRRARSRLARQAYDRAFVFEYDPRYVDLVSGSSAAVHRLAATDRMTHYARRCVDLVVNECGTDDPGWARLSVGRAGVARAGALLSRIGVTPSTVVVGMHPTSHLASKPALPWSAGRMKHRLWPMEHYAALARQLTTWADGRGVDLRIVIDVLPADRSYAEAIRSLSGGAVTILGGAPDFERYKALLARMDLLVSIDTGPVHVAAAVGTRVVALYSRKHPAVWGPYVPPEQFVALRAEDTPTAEHGMAAIAPAHVFEACQRFLRSAP